MATKGYGEILKKARESKNMTYKELHKILKMDPAYLKALEDESLSIFEKPVYMRLFLKTYAKFLKVDVEEVMRLYDFSPEIQVAEKKKEKMKEHMIIGDIIKETEDKDLEQAKSSQPITELSIMTKKNLMIAGTAAAVILVILILIFVFKGKGGSSQSQNNNVYVPTVTAPTTLKITVKAKDDVWMKSRTDAGEEDFLLKKGEEKKFSDINRVVFLVGNAGGVEFNLNGEPLGTIGEPGEVINGLIFEAGKNWYIDKTQGFKRGADKPASVNATSGQAQPAASAATATSK
jgi:transcriptional regulator with XRE-family HTH domain